MLYNRIILVGSAGSGKSFLSKKIAEITKIPLIHLDNEFWKPNWVKTPKEEWIKKQKKMFLEPQWIIDGNYNSTLELRFAAADAVVFLDIPPAVCLISAIKRHGKMRSDLPETCVEKFDHEFLDFLKLIWKYPQTGKLKILALHEKYPDKPFIVLKSRKKVNEWITNLLKEFE